VTTAEARALLARFILEAEGRWTYYDYPFWAMGVEKQAPALLAAIDADERGREEDPATGGMPPLADLLAELARVIAAKRPKILAERRKATPDSELAIMRYALQAPTTHFWLWVEGA